MNETLYSWTLNFHKVVRQQNSGAVEGLILPYSDSLSANPKVKELLKSVHIWESYRKNKRGTFFVANGVRTYIRVRALREFVTLCVVTVSVISVKSLSSVG